MPGRPPVPVYTCEHCQGKVTWGTSGKITHAVPVCDPFLKVIGRGAFYIEEINTLAREWVERSIKEVKK